jgi:hypothetical protein
MPRSHCWLGRCGLGRAEPEVFLKHRDQLACAVDHALVAVVRLGLARQPNRAEGKPERQRRAIFAKGRRQAFELAQRRSLASSAKRSTDSALRS